MTRRRGVSGLVGLVILVVAPILAAPGAVARTGGGEQAPITLVDRTPWVDDGDVFDLTVTVPAAAAVQATVHRELVATGGRSRFRSQLAGSELGDVIADPVPLIRGTDGWSASIRIAGSPAAPPDDGTTTLVLPDPGVYPIDVRAFDPDGAEIGAMLTHLVRNPTPGAFPTLSSVVVVDGPHETATRPDGSIRRSPDSTANIRSVTSAAAAAPDVPFIFAAAPETIDALESVERSRLARSSASVPDAPWADLDLGAWLADPALESALEHQRTRGRRAIDRARIERTPVAVLDQPPTAGRREALIEANTGVLLTSTSLAVDLPTPAVGQLGPLRVSDQSLDGLVVDAGLQAHLEAQTDDSMLAVSHLLADLAVLFYDRPRDERVVMLWVAAPGDLGAGSLSALLDALASGGIASAVDAREVLGVEEAVARVTLARRPPPDLGGYADGLAAASAVVGTWDSMLPSDDDRAAELEAALDATAARDVIDDADEWFARTRAVVDAELVGISVPQKQTVTLTEREADLPIRVDNDLGYPANVLLRLESTRLDVLVQEEDGIPVRLEPGSNDVLVAVSARSSGSFPLRVGVLTPDGQRMLADARFSVRSTVLNGVGVALTVGSLLVLLIWWARHFRKGRRDGRLIERDRAGAHHERVVADH